MAYLHDTPKTLTILNFARPVIAAFFFLSLIPFAIACGTSKDPEPIFIALGVSLSIGSVYLTFSCMYYITKAACLYIQKEEETEEESE